MEKEIVILLGLLIIIGSAIFLLNSDQSFTVSSIREETNIQTFNPNHQAEKTIDTGSVDFNCCNCVIKN